MAMMANAESPPEATCISLRHLAEETRKAERKSRPPGCTRMAWSLIIN